MSDSIQIFQDRQSLIQAATEFIVELGVQSIASRGNFTVALSGGATPRSLYVGLAEPVNYGPLDWSATFLFWGDERAVPPDHVDSNYHMVKEALLDHIPLPPEHVFRIRGELPPDAAGVAYHHLLECSVPLKESGFSIPRFDLALLGLGEDGHTASLFPGTAALAVEDRWATDNYVDMLAAWRVTLTYPVLNNAREVVFLVSGGTKASILAQVLQGPSQPDRFPAQAVSPKNGHLLWFIDSAAAAAL